MAASSLEALVASRYWHEQDAQRVIAAWRRSGLSLAEFARRHGFHPRRLRDRLRGMEGEGLPRAGSGRVPFVELVEVAPAPLPSALEVSVGGAVIRVPVGFDVAHLASVVVTLRGIPC